MLVLGSASVVLVFISTLVLGTLIYNLLTSLGFIDILKRVSAIKTGRRDYYECGFTPQEQKPIKVSTQFLLITVFFILYDVELTFGFPAVSSLSYGGLVTTLLVQFFFFVLYISLQVDYNRHALS